MINLLRCFCFKWKLKTQTFTNGCPNIWQLLCRFWHSIFCIWNHSFDCNKKKHSAPWLLLVYFILHHSIQPCEKSTMIISTRFVILSLNIIQKYLKYHTCLCNPHDDKLPEDSDFRNKCIYKSKHCSTSQWKWGTFRYS